MENFNIVASLCSWACWFESYFAKKKNQRQVLLFVYSLLLLPFGCGVFALGPSFVELFLESFLI